MKVLIKGGSVKNEFCLWTGMRMVYQLKRLKKPEKPTNPTWCTWIPAFSGSRWHETLFFLIGEFFEKKKLNLKKTLPILHLGGATSRLFLTSNCRFFRWSASASLLIMSTNSLCGSPSSATVATVLPPAGGRGLQNMEIVKWIQQMWMWFCEMGQSAVIIIIMLGTGHMDLYICNLGWIIHTHIH